VFAPVSWTLPLDWRMLSATEIRAQLAQLRQRERPIPPVRVLLGAVEGTDGEALVERWYEAVHAVRELDRQVRWGSNAHRQKIAAIVALPHVVDGMRGVIVVEQNVPLAWMAVLVADGSEESADAILPHVDSALDEGGAQLEALNQLKRFAHTPRMVELFDESRRLMDVQRATSPALDFVESLGLSRKKRALYYVWLTSGDVPRAGYVLHVTIDSHAKQWLQVAVRRHVNHDCVAATRFDATQLHKDELSLGRCAPGDLPAYAARVGRLLAIAWERVTVGSRVRAEDCRRLKSWLLP
jgi:hypothetical protein